MAKFSYSFKTTDTGKQMFLPKMKGMSFVKRGMLTYEGKYKMGLLPSGGTGLIKVKKWFCEIRLYIKGENNG